MTQLGKRWWMTAETAGGAAVQLLVWGGLLALSIFGVLVDDGPQWWLGMVIWTLGFLASSATLLVRSGLLRRGAARPAMTPAGAIAWGLGTAVLGALAATALTVLISTGSLVFLVFALLAAAGAVWVAARGGSRSATNA